MSHPRAPDVIADRYQLGPMLGRGGMGDVHAGVDQALDREVAVKFLRGDLADQSELRHRFVREARAAARITHPHVVAIYDIGEHDGLPYIVMERLSGRTLADEMAAGPIAPGRACALVVEVLSALEAAHQLGVIHRDIKPGNILITADEHAKVADFGIAKLAEDLDHTATGMLFGTAAYLAPERLAGRPATPASDLYSVGVVLFEALTGEPAFRADTPLALVASISEGVSTPLATRRPDLDRSVVGVVERAMAPDPADRFATASIMAAGLAPGARHRAGSRFDTPTVPRATSASDPGIAPTPTPERADGAEPPAATEVLVQADPPELAPRRRRPVGRTRRRTAMALAGFVIVGGIVVVATTRDASRSPGEPTPSTTATGTPIPPSLERALDDLDQAVQP